MLDITLQNFAGRSVPIQLNDNFNLAEFKAVIIREFGPMDSYRFFVDSIQLDLNNESRFNEQKSHITDDKTIFVLGRLRGGGYLDTGTFIDIIIVDLPDVLKKIKKTNYQCAICYNNKPCNKICHAMVCDECFTSYFKSCNLQIKCLTCSEIVSSKDVFNNATFDATLRSYSELQSLLKHIDCQVCSCGALALNETMYPKQKCIECSRDFCFFCNKNWNDATMKNNKLYTCSSGNCDYETRISFKLTTFNFDTTLSIPDRRCCPKCFTAGAYGERCKYNTCLACNYKFCFFCLETEEECCRKYQKNYSKQCVEPIEQTYAIFPRLNTS